MCSFGLQQELSPAFRFTDNMPHPRLITKHPAITTAFNDANGTILGVYTKYLLDGTSDANARIFYGSPENTTATIYSGSSRTIVISDLMTALAAKEVLLGDETEKVCSALGIQGSFSIKAFLDLIYLPSIQFCSRTRTVVVILNSKKDSKDAYFNQVIAKSLEFLFNPKFDSLLTMVNKEKNLKDFVVKYKKQEWRVIKDRLDGDERHIQARRPETHDLHLTVNTKTKSVRIKDKTIDNPDTAITTCLPKITVKIVLSNDPSTSRETFQELTERMCHQVFSACNLQDFLAINLPPKKVAELAVKARQKEQEALENNMKKARKIYATSQTKASEAIRLYFEKRKIFGALPSAWRYLERMPHPWSNTELPVIIVPFMKRIPGTVDTLTGIHRIFCNPDGSPIEDKKHRKVSLGDTATSVYTPIYEHNVSEKDGEKEIHTIFISEGIENALVARDVLLDVIQNSDSESRSKLCQELSIAKSFAIRASVGINGMEEIPLEHTTETIIIMADNDGNNPDAKQTIINTVSRFLRGNRTVKIALPMTGKKMDLNDAYLNGNTQAVTDILRNAVTIHSAQELGSAKEPLQQSLERIMLART